MGFLFQKNLNFKIQFLEIPIEINYGIYRHDLYFFFLFGILLLLDILFPDRFNATSEEFFDWRWIDPSKDREVIRRKRRERKKEKKRLKR